MNLFERIQNKTLRNVYKIFFLVCLSAVITYIVWITGGTRSAAPQLYLIVILLAAYFWKMIGGVLAALALALVSGPLMPMDRALGTMQAPGNWMTRLVIFVTVGFLMGYLLMKNISLTVRMSEKDLTSQLTGLYNTNKLFPDLDGLTACGERFCLVFFDIRNLGEISKYVDYGILGEIVQRIISAIQSSFDSKALYSSDYNEYILVLKEYDEQLLEQQVLKSIDDILAAVRIDQYAFHLVIKAGIAISDGKKDKAADLFNKARIASNQGEDYDSSVYSYNPDFDSERRLFHEISGSIQKAISNEEFYLVYHPIISLHDEKISSVEVLARWNRGGREPVGPHIFIKIAEQTGLAPRITKEIVRQLIRQLRIWEDSGLTVRSSVNITAGELLDDALVKWIRGYLDQHHPDRSLLGIEITERVFAARGEKLNRVLAYLQDRGYRISIDDFGTGYNTLTDLFEMNADVLKIDRYFINRINENNIKALIKHTIELAHELGLLVVAEGVETKEQLLALKALGCDEVQGFYFTTPLLPDDFADYYLSFDMKDYILQDS